MNFSGYVVSACWTAPNLKFNPFPVTPHPLAFYPLFGNRLLAKLEMTPQIPHGTSLIRKNCPV